MRPANLFGFCLSVVCALYGVALMTVASADNGSYFPITFDEATPPAVTPFGGATSTIEAGPAGGDGNALKIVRAAGEDYAGAYVAVAGIPNDAGRQTLSARVYSPMAGIPMVTKLEFGDNTGTGEVSASETVVEGWQTLSWTYSNLSPPNDYNRFVILPNLGTIDSESYYFDNIDLVVAAFSADGAVESKKGGFKFPDGTVQLTAATAGPSEPAMPTYAIGDTGPAGGIVFYVTEGGLHGLEAALADHGGYWGCNGTAITGADGIILGTGAQNTGDILTWCMEAGIAARIADNFTFNNYSDWFLPSKDELGLMYDNIGPGAAPPNTNLGGFAGSLYYSSSEYDDSNVWIQYFSSGDQAADGKGNGNLMRAVRAF